MTGRDAHNLKLKKHEYVQDEILAAATVLFSKRGFRAVTISEVAASVGYTKSVVYYYFKNKNELLWQIFNRIHASYHEIVSDVLERDMPPEQAIRLLIYNHAHNVMRRADWTAIYFQQESELKNEQRSLIRKRKREYDAMIEEVYQRGVQRGVFKDIPPHIAVSGLLGMCNWLHTWYDENGPVSAEDIAAYYVDVLTNGFSLAEANTSS